MLLRGIFLVSATLLLAFLSRAVTLTQGTCSKENQLCEDDDTDEVTISVVACGDRLEESLMMLKSAVALGRAPLFFHVFADRDLMPKFEESLGAWVDLVWWRKLRFQVHPIQFPPGTEKAWRDLFKPCACQRLFIPSLLKDVSATLYLDTDTLFHRPPEDIWRLFRRFNGSHIAALAPEGESPSSNWYIRFARHPFYPPLGVNSGVMLMNLSRMRSFGWEKLLWPLLTKYKRNITWGDQDIINIIFSQRQETLMTFGCEWNYRPDHCMYGMNCGKAGEAGAFIIHGSRSYFHLPDKQPAFLLVYQAWKSYPLGSDLLKQLLEPMKHSFIKSQPPNRKALTCLQHSNVLFAALEKSVLKHPIPSRSAKALT